MPSWQSHTCNCYEVLLPVESSSQSLDTAFPKLCIWKLMEQSMP